MVNEISVCLSQISFLSLKEKIILLKNLDSLDKLALMSIEDISQMVGRPVNPEFWNGKKAAALAKRSMAIIERMKCNGVCVEEGSYPALLREAGDSPLVLFYRGNIDVLGEQCVSVVGTRQICREAAEAAFEFARDAALDGVTVVSGLAYGTDAWAHKGALAGHRHDCGEMCGAKTVAILPCGIDSITPPAHKVLVEHILAAGGCIASEYAPGTPADPWRYVQRTRIIAALSPATVVVEAPPGSGARITADFAVDYNRDVYFHEAGFCESAKRIADGVLKKLCASNKNGAQVKSKKKPERLLEEGAPVINNYADYVAARREAPGMHSCKKNGQLQLF